MLSCRIENSNDPCTLSYDNDGNNNLIIRPNDYYKLNKFKIEPQTYGTYIFDVIVYENNNQNVIGISNMNRQDSTSITIIVKSPSYPQISMTSYDNNFDKIKAVGKFTSSVEYTWSSEPLLPNEAYQVPQIARLKLSQGRRRRRRGGSQELTLPLEIDDSYLLPSTSIN